MEKIFLSYILTHIWIFFNFNFHNECSFFSSHFPSLFFKFSQLLFLQKNKLQREIVMTETNYIGNISTIVKFVSMTLAGYLIGVAASKGLNLPIDTAALSQLISTIIFFIIAYTDAKYPNSFDWLGNGNLVDMGTILGYPSQEVVLNEEYETEIEGDQEDGC